LFLFHFFLVSYFGFIVKVCGGGTGSFRLVCAVYLPLDATSLWYQEPVLALLLTSAPAEVSNNGACEDAVAK